MLKFYSLPLKVIQFFQLLFLDNPKLLKNNKYFVKLPQKSHVAGANSKLSTFVSFIFQMVYFHTAPEVHRTILVEPLSVLPNNLDFEVNF